LVNFRIAERPPLFDALADLIVCRHPQREGQMLALLQATTAIQTVPLAAPQSFGESLRLSLTGALALLLSAIPRILGFIIIVLIGWIVASLVAKAVLALLRAVRFNDVAQRTGIRDFVQRMNPNADPAGVVAGVVKWLVRIVVLLVAFGVLGLPALSDVLRQFLLWLPNLIVALAILFIAGLAANALANVVRGATSEAGFANPNTLATIARVAVWAFAIVVAVNQLGIAQTLINTLFMGVVGMLALAGGISFGLGGRDLAAETLESWREQAREARPKAERAARSAKRQMEADDTD
jgi:hypothetical protein